MRSSNIAFVIDHFRQVQTDQYAALGAAIGPDRKVIGVEIFSTTHPDYPFGSWTGEGFIHERVFEHDARAKPGLWRPALRILGLCRKYQAGTVFLCHYERPYIFLAALLLRLTGRSVYVMGDSKFDDYPRHFWRELGKKILYQPYQGGLAASPRCAEYQRFLGVPEDKIKQNYYALSLDRVRKTADHPPAPEGIAFADRDFVCIARLIEKKNLATLLEAYALYVDQTAKPRKLVLCGSGPLESSLKSKAAELSLSHNVVFRGNLGPVDVAAALARGLCLILPSYEEQYGIVVIEAQAMGLPIVISTNPGARDRQVRAGINGFVVEPDNAPGMAYFMQALHSDEQLWRAMAIQAQCYAKRSDVDQFVASVLELTP
jgi:L-malate glycosyltransferase